MTKLDVMATIDPDFAQSFERNPTEPYFVASECHDSCTDPFCPYSHGHGWKIDGVLGLFETEEEAKAARK